MTRRRRGGATQARAAARLPGPAGPARMTAPRRARSRPPPDDARLYDFAPALYVLLDAAGLILDINEAGVRLLRLPRRSLIGQPFRTLVADDMRRVFLDHLRRTRRTDSVVESVIQLRAGDRGHITMRLCSRRARASGQVVCPTVALDLTEYESLERARQAAESQRDRAQREGERARAGEAARDRLIAVVSHELRNPLSPVLVAADQLVAWPGLPERVRRLAEVIKRNVELEARLIDDLLDLTRVTQGRLELELCASDVHDIVLDAVNACAPVAEARMVSVTLELQASLHHARVDGTRLRQVFWNLITNAVKFSEPGGSVTVSSSNDDGRLRIAVRDRGIGMTAEALEHLFSPFAERQAPVSHRGGLGLGLNISKGIVEAHGGRILASSPGPGQGATVEVELDTCDAAPAAPASAEPSLTAIAEPADRSTAAEPTQGRGRVLVVEDHHDTGMLITMFLSQQGYDVTLAQTLSEALRELEHEWDVVLSDLGLADGSGLELAERARAMPKRPGKMIALTGYGTSTDRAASRAAGFDEHLVKPIDLNELLAALENPSGPGGGTPGT